MVKFSEQPLKLIASASILPGPPVTNEQLFAALVSRCSARSAKSKVRRAKAIARRLAITHRHLTRNLHTVVCQLSPDAPELGVQVLSSMLGERQLDVQDIDYLITHTATPHTQIPGNSAWIADRIGLHNPHMELRQACTGFANALFIASGLPGTTNSINTVAVCGMEVGSVFFELADHFLDEEQLLNYMQMGDGAGGVLLAACDSGVESKTGNGRRGNLQSGGIISDIYFGHIGVGRDPGFHLAGAGSSDIIDHSRGVPHFRHNGAMVKEHGADLFLTAIQCINERGYSLHELDWILPHQANGRIGQMLSRETGIAAGKFVVDAGELGNLGSAAIWVSFDRLIRSGKLKRGQKLLVLGAEATKYMYGGFIYQH
ncbi:hypothetical protein AB833_08985 [Chromatiales bacterium (ex Bugula neritina AB1)]|nr:hypothetical protein AB833_08985 [Chromatiales bacterium (ex Bugula neritina AB1)]